MAAAYSIVGVAPREFRGIIPIVQPVLWVPLMQWNDVRPGNAAGFEQRDQNSANVIARLKPGVTPRDGARATWTRSSPSCESVYPDDYKQNGITLARAVRRRRASDVPEHRGRADQPS